MPIEVFVEEFEIALRVRVDIVRIHESVFFKLCITIIAIDLPRVHDAETNRIDGAIQSAPHAHGTFGRMNFELVLFVQVDRLLGAILKALHATRTLLRSEGNQGGVTKRSDPFNFEEEGHDAGRTISNRLGLA